MENPIGNTVKWKNGEPYDVMENVSFIMLMLKVFPWTFNEFLRKMKSFESKTRFESQ